MKLRTLSAVLLATGFLAASPPTLADEAAEKASEEARGTDEEMIELAWDSGCFNCHDVNEHVRGPAWVKVAARYRGDDEAFERLVRTVIDGGSGNWGSDTMSPNRRVPEEDVRTLVAWLLLL